MHSHHTPGSFFSAKVRPGMSPKVMKGGIYALAIYAGCVAVGGMMWIALASADDQSKTEALRNQEAFSGYRTAGVAR